MLTFTTFLLLATLLFVTIVAIQAMRRERKELQYSSHLLDSVIELQEELTTLYQRVESKESLLVEKTQQIKALQEAVFEAKESSNFLLESYQEELDTAQDCIWDKQRQVSELAEANQKVADTLLALSYKEKPVTPRELSELREVALRWDQIPF